MTMPHLMNCSHSESGWCLECVGKLHAETERLQSELEESAREESAALTQTEKYSIENGRLTKELADARKAALSLYTALLYDDLTRWEILETSLEKWPWLGPKEPFAAEHDYRGPEVGRGKATAQQCDKCGREFESLSRDDHPEGILWCHECAAKEMDSDSES